MDGQSDPMCGVGSVKKKATYHWRIVYTRGDCGSHNGLFSLVLFPWKGITNANHIPHPHKCPLPLRASPIVCKFACACKDQKMASIHDKIQSNNWVWKITSWNSELQENYPSQMSWLSLKINKFRFTCKEKISILLEEFMQYASNEWR